MPEDRQLRPLISAVEEQRQDDMATMLRTLLERLESGEKFTSMCVLYSTPDYVNYPWVGKKLDLLAACSRLEHRINSIMDED